MKGGNDVMTVESADLAGLSRFERWRSDWEAEFFAPYGRRALAVMMTSMMGAMGIPPVMMGKKGE